MLCQGLILKIEYGDYIIIFDELLGRRIIKLAKNRVFYLVSGAIIEYSISYKKQYEFLLHIDMIQVPLPLARHDVIFFHQLLEICLICVPKGIACEDSFRFLRYILGHPKPNFSKGLKVFLLLKILWQFGIYAETMLEDRDMIGYLHSESLEDILKENYTKDDEQLQQWLQACLMRKLKVKNIDKWEQ